MHDKCMCDISCIFKANDKARTGFLAAVQARGILLQTGLSQQTLATVWNLSDIDKVLISLSLSFYVFPLTESGIRTSKVWLMY